MSKYSEALEKLSKHYIEGVGYLDDNEELNLVLQDAITKAEKYDAMEEYHKKTTGCQGNGYLDVSYFRIYHECNERCRRIIKEQEQTLENLYEKAGKYDSLKQSYDYLDKAYDSIKISKDELQSENNALIKDVVGFKQDIDEAYKTIDRLKAEINTLVEGIKEWLLIFYNQKKNRRGEFNLTFDEYVRGMIAEYNDNLQEEDVDFEYVSKIKAMLEIVEGKK